MIRGKVIDSRTRETLDFPNVRVVDPSGKVRNDKAMSLISSSGAFTLPNALPGDLVMVSFVGYKTKITPIIGLAPMTISLERATYAIPEAVVSTIKEKAKNNKPVLLAVAAIALVAVIAAIAINKPK